MKVESAQKVLNAANSGMQFFKYILSALGTIFAIYTFFNNRINIIENDLKSLNTKITHNFSILDDKINYINVNRKTDLDRVQSTADHHSNVNKAKIEALELKIHNLEIELVMNMCKPINGYVKKYSR